MPNRDQVNLMASGDVSVHVVRGESLNTAWRMSKDSVQVDLTDPRAGIDLADGSTVDLAEYLVSIGGVVDLDIPGEITSTWPSGLHYWTVQARGDDKDITIAAGPFRVLPSANYPED